MDTRFARIGSDLVGQFALGSDVLGLDALGLRAFGLNVMGLMYYNYYIGHRIGMDGMRLMIRCAVSTEKD